MAIAPRKKIAAPAKKVAAKKTTVPAKVATKRPALPAKKVATPVKKAATAPVKSSPRPKPKDPATDSQYTDFANTLSGLIADGALDNLLEPINEAVQSRERVIALADRKRAEAAAKRAAAKPAEKEIPMPKRTAKVALEIGKKYLVGDGVPLSGATVTFLGFKIDDDLKSKCEVVRGVGKYETGAKVMVPSSLLKPAAVRGRVKK